MATPLERLTGHLARLATHYDMIGQWPERSLAHLTAAGAWTWNIPRAYGGLALPPESQLRAYEAVAAGCLSSLLILSQRDGACELIASSANDGLKDELLPRLAAHEMMASVGISQLTTSQQGRKPALIAEPTAGGYRLRGYMPWVTAAEKCDLIVTGAALSDDKQVLAALPTDLAGLQIDAPMKLMALESSRTSEVHCRDVMVESRWVLGPPAGKALSGSSPVKLWVVAAAGLGLGRAMIQQVQSHAGGAAGPLAEQAEDLAARYEAVRERFYKSAEQLGLSDEEGPPTTGLRVAVNDLLVRLAVGTLTFVKGSGFIRQRDAQRLVREAMFFLVWSATEDVRVQTLGRFLDRPEPESRSLAR